MDIKEFETIIINEINNIILKIINDFIELSISAKSRSGAEISDFLEDKFVEYTNENKYFVNSEKSPKGATKNPWDAKTIFCLNKIKETIWIDFKALKKSSKDSNPDIGTPSKVIDFIKEGNFYLVYVHVFYEETKNGLKFVQIDNEYTKIYFLKDISHTFRRNPKNQLQVNMSALPEYRTREDFIKLLIEKIKESNERQIKISEKSLKTLSKKEEELLSENYKSESKILENLKSMSL
jgi:hypothetical protein